MYQPLNEISNKYKRLPQHLQQKRVKNQTLNASRGQNMQRTGYKKPVVYEREKHVDSISMHEVNTAVRTLLV
jgi:hypothetical protein